MDLASYSDEELVVMVREHDRELYSEIIRRYQTKLAHYLRKFITDTVEQEDVLQEVFIKAYRNLFAFDSPRKFSSWIYRITHNEAINHLKKRRPNIISLDEQEWEIIDQAVDINHRLAASQEREKVIAAMGKLKDKYRQPLVLFFFEDRTYEEIGEILRLPTSTVGTLIRRGKEQLKQLLKEIYA